ncbi:ADC synthase [Chytridium lagenaria]|nr:ADC synthase [Chytridium lagenaria]
MFVDRFLVFDHELRQIYIVSLERSDSKGEFADLKQWCLKTIERIKKLSNSPIEGLKLAHRRDLYIENIRKSLAAIKEGETYEVCLTTQIKGKIPRSSRHPEVVQDLNGDTSDMSVLGFYLALRARNAAPYASFLDFGKRFRRLTVAGSSPERFLQCDNKGWVEMKPIKGTLARPVLAEMGGDIEAWKKEDENRKAILEANEKDRAENLMIVDLIRNDLNLICDPKTVSVPHLMKVETYATVHQLVTTVRGSLRPNLTCIDAIRATFPPGSMTGAPKLRTCQILEDLEGYNQPRGPYSGCLGFLSISGSADMSVVIRTAVFCEAEDDKDCLEVRVGAGGAVYDEMLLKANSVLPSLAGTFGVKLRQ